MPVLSRFYGIIIRMYFQQVEHNPPHVHALYGEDMAAVIIQTGEVLEGHLPPKALSMVREWVKIHQNELLRMWETQEFESISPLE
ncbi:MAG: DUF4160 domain-containing protein [Clostridia bacterium]|nr:DUF4160 domain-containing protein [Clostridia bacterium]MBP5766110.1 DUF4160 domain-containing protein [Clostridia bacterium]